MPREIVAPLVAPEVIRLELSVGEARGAEASVDATIAHVCFCLADN
jgi:hypothetical protein